MDDAKRPSPLSADRAVADDLTRCGPAPGTQRAVTPPISNEDEDTATELTHRPRSQARLTRDAIKAADERSSSRVVPLTAHPSAHRPVVQTNLKPFADQLIAIAEQLRDGAINQPSSGLTSEVSAPFGRAEDRLHAAVTTPTKTGAKNRKAYVELARDTYTKRRKRAVIFGDPELFGEPGWDILLDLYIAQAEEKPVSVSSACIGSAAPPTTGLRWLGVLAEQGLVERQHDPADQRRVLVKLTDKGLSAMDEYFSSSASQTGDRRDKRR